MNELKKVFSGRCSVKNRDGTYINVGIIRLFENESKHRPNSPDIIGSITIFEPRVKFLVSLWRD